MSDDPYPEHSKLAAISDKSQTCGEFVDWLEQHDIYLCRPDRTHPHYWPIHDSITTLLAAFFGIDLATIEAEKRQMIEAMREANDA